jgi:hypothetical protein
MPWIKNREKLKTESLDSMTIQTITTNLKNFRLMGTFQNGVVSLMANLAASEQEL